MATSGHEQKNRFKQIFADGWEEFKRTHPRYAAVDEVVTQVKRQVVQLGYIVVLQTAGRSARYNPHLHVIMTDGGLRADGTWQRLGYLPYALLHRAWQTHVLEMIAPRLAG